MNGDGDGKSHRDFYPQPRDALPPLGSGRYISGLPTDQTGDLKIVVIMLLLKTLGLHKPRDLLTWKGDVATGSPPHDKWFNAAQY